VFNTESVNSKIITPVMALLHEEEDNHHEDKRSNKACTEGRQSWEPENAQATGEFVIVEKFSVCFSLKPFECGWAGRSKNVK